MGVGLEGSQGAIQCRSVVSMKQVVARASRPCESKRTGETPVPLRQRRFAKALRLFESPPAREHIFSPVK